MPLAKPWQELTRETVASAPDRFGIYELGDEEGNVVEIGTGPLRDELKTALAYSTGSTVRWEATGSRERARDLAETHRERL